MDASLEARFWPKVERRSEADCWEWRAARDGHGYGAISATRERRIYQAHRVSYEIANGAIPSGMHVLHRCDNPACVSPHHLFLGTHRDNMADMGAKGRHTRRSSNVSSETARAIRASEGSARQIARSFGLSTDTVRRIRSQGTGA